MSTALEQIHRIDKSVARPVEIHLEFDERGAFVSCRCDLPNGEFGGKSIEQGSETHCEKFPIDENYFPYTKVLSVANRKIFYFARLVF